MDLAKLKEQIKTNSLSGVYVFCGRESYLLSHYMDTMIKKLIDPQFAEFNLRFFDARRFDAEAFADAAESYPVWSEHKLIVVDDMLPPVFDEEMSARIKDGLSRLAPQNIVVFRYGPDAEPDKKYASLKKLFAKLDAETVSFEPPSAHELNAWAARHFAAGGKTISPADIEYMLSLCDNSMLTLSLEIEKLCSYCTLDRVERRHIDAVVTRSPDAKMYELSDAVFSRRCAAALNILYELLEQKNEPLYILGAVSSAFNSLWQIKLCLGAAQGRDVMAKRTGLSPGLISRYIRVCDGFSEKQITDALKMCARTDITLKSSGADGGAVLETLIAALCVGSFTSWGEKTV